MVSSWKSKSHLHVVYIAFWQLKCLQSNDMLHINTLIETCQSALIALQIETACVIKSGHNHDISTLCLILKRGSIPINTLLNSLPFEFHSIRIGIGWFQNPIPG